MRLFDEGDAPRRCRRRSGPDAIMTAVSLCRGSSYSMILNRFSDSSLTVRPRPGEFVVEVDVAIRRHRLAVEDVPEEFVADLDIDLGEELGDGRVEAGHDDVVVVHLAGVRNDRHLEGLGQGGDLARLADAADAVGVELDVVERIGLEQLAEAEDGELVLAARDGDAAVGLQLP